MSKVFITAEVNRGTLEVSANLALIQVDNLLDELEVMGEDAAEAQLTLEKIVKKYGFDKLELVKKGYPQLMTEYSAGTVG